MRSLDILLLIKEAKLSASDGVDDGNDEEDLRFSSLLIVSQRRLAFSEDEGTRLE